MAIVSTQIIGPDYLGSMTFNFTTEGGESTVVIWWGPPNSESNGVLCTQVNPTLWTVTFNPFVEQVFVEELLGYYGDADGNLTPHLTTPYFPLPAAPMEEDQGPVVSNPTPNNLYSVEKYNETEVTTAGPQVPVTGTLDPVQLDEQYQRINASRFMK